MRDVCLWDASLRDTCKRPTPMRCKHVRCPSCEIYAPIRCKPIKYTHLKCRPIRCTPLTCSSVRCTPLRYTPMRCTPYEDACQRGIYANEKYMPARDVRLGEAYAYEIRACERYLPARDECPRDMRVSRRYIYHRRNSSRHDLSQAYTS